MKNIEKFPLKEPECWQLIHDIGEQIKRRCHGIYHGPLCNSLPQFEYGLDELRELYDGLVKKTCEAFGLIHPKEKNVPTGKKQYQDWYLQMKIASLKN